MICVPVIERNLSICFDALQKADLIEIRFDKAKFNDYEIEEIFATGKAIATFRPENSNDSERISILSKAIKSGAKYVDVEIESDENFRKEIINIARNYNCQVIISYHNFEFTPSENELKDILFKCYDLGADVAKVATMVNTKIDIAHLLSLYKYDKRMVILGMGELGKITRIASLFLGAEFTFACLDDLNSSAPGQIPVDNFKKILNLINYKHE